LVYFLTFFFLGGWELIRFLIFLFDSFEEDFAKFEDIFHQVQAYSSGFGRIKIEFVLVLYEGNDIEAKRERIAESCAIEIPRVYFVRKEENLEEEIIEKLFKYIPFEPVHLDEKAKERIQLKKR